HPDHRRRSATAGDDADRARCRGIPDGNGVAFGLLHQRPPGKPRRPPTPTTIAWQREQRTRSRGYLDGNRFHHRPRRAGDPPALLGAPDDVDVLLRLALLFPGIGDPNGLEAARRLAVVGV